MFQVMKAKQTWKHRNEILVKGDLEKFLVSKRWWIKCILMTVIIINWKYRKTSANFFLTNAIQLLYFYKYNIFIRAFICSR